VSRPLSTTLVALVAIAFAAAACSSAGSAEPAWTYGPTLGPVAAATATPAPTPTAVPTPTAAPTIALSEWKVDVASTMQAGKVTFAISNLGTTAHELLIFKSDLAPSAYPTDPAGDIVEDATGVTLLSDGENIDPAGSQQRTVELTPGTYLFVCNIPGHFKSGMFTQVTVTP